MWRVDLGAAAVVDLTWVSGGDGLYSYAVYAAKGAVDSSQQWAFVTATTMTRATLTLAQLGLSNATTMSFRVQARLITLTDTVRSEFSAVAVAYWRGTPPAELTFITRPVVTARVGVAYSYQAKASEQDTTAVIRYALLAGPSAMTVDSVSGQVSWTPTVAGSAEVTLKAWDTSGRVALQRFDIEVMENDTVRGNVSGVITDSATGHGIGEAFVAFSSVLGLGRPTFVTHTDDSGRYTVSLFPGAYRVTASASGFLTGSWTGDSNGVLVVTAGINVAVNIALAPAPHGMIVGTVIDDSTRNPIAGARVLAIRKGPRDSSDDTTDIDIDVRAYGHVFVGETNAQGQYALTVPTGMYVVRADARGYIGHWADTGTDIRTATVFTVANNGTDTVNFALVPMPPPPVCTISGMVSGSGGAIANATVVLTAVGDDGLDLDDREAITVQTDTAGRYTARVRCGDVYVAFAFAEGFVGQFYQNKLSALLADRITANGAVTGIDFLLQTASTAGVSVSGSVYACDSATTPLAARVVAFELDAATNLLVNVDVVRTDSTGAYTFQSLASGTYVLLAIPSDRHYAPSYYTVDGHCTNSWREASRIEVASSALTGLNIYARTGGRHLGWAHLRGHVHVRGGVVGMTSLPGAAVFAINAHGEIAGQAVTDANGDFDMDDMEPGTFTVSIDLVEYVTITPAVMTCDYDQNTAPSGDVTAQYVGVTGVSEQRVIPTGVTLQQNYPNPFNPHTTIAFALPKSDAVDLSVYTVTGQKIATLVHAQLAPGSYQIPFDATALPMGTYVYRLQTAGGVVLSRRMVELK